jgi:hypothetical protein
MTRAQVDAASGSEWTVARSEEEVEVLLSRTRGFHDSFVRFAHLDSGTYVTNRFESVDEKYASLWMLVQTQWADTPAVELLFEELERIEFVPNYDLQGSVNLSSSGCDVAFAGCRIRAAKLHFRFGASEDLGPSPPAFHQRRLPKSFALPGEQLW